MHWHPMPCADSGQRVAGHCAGARQAATDEQIEMTSKRKTRCEINPRLDKQQSRVGFAHRCAKPTLRLSLCFI